MKFIRVSAKKYMAMLIVCAMIVGLCPVGSYASSSPFAFDSTSGTITDYDVSAGGLDVVIPSTIGGVAVEHIGVGAFWSYDITSVIIPNSVISIDRLAFCDNDLTSVIIPARVTSIGADAFSLNDLTSVTIPNSVESIAHQAFRHNKLETVTIPDSVTSIGYNAFYDNQLTTIIMDKADTTIGLNLLTVMNNKFREAYTTGGIGIYEGTQTGAWAKTPFTFDITTKTITNYDVVAGGKDVVIPSIIGGVAVEHIGVHAFLSKELETVVIPEGIISIGTGAFYDNKLTTVTIPASVTSIGEYVFGLNKLTTVTIPDSIVKISKGAFSENKLATVTIPVSVTSIGDYAFAINALTTVTIPDSVTSIGLSAFYNNQLISIIMERAKTSIGDNLLGDANNKFRDAYGTGGRGIYEGTQTGDWIRALNDAEKVVAVKPAIETALNNLPVSNATTAQNVLDAVQGTSLQGVSVVWDQTTGFTKTNATSTTSGAITGVLKLTLGGETQEITVNKIIAQLPETGGGGSSKDDKKSESATSTQSAPAPEVENPVTVIVNGKAENAGTETATTDGGRSVVKVRVNNEVINRKIEEAIKNNLTGEDNLIQVSITDTKSDVVNLEITGDIIKKLEERTFELSIKHNNIEYLIPSEEFMISKVAKELGVAESSLKDITIEVKITTLDEIAVSKYNEMAKANGTELMISPVAFEIVAKTTQKEGTIAEVKVNNFNRYVGRTMEMPVGADSSMITTGIVFNPNDTYSPVPTEVFQKDGKWYVKLNSLTNSNYSVVWNPVTVKSVENHWSKDVVNDMASRLIITNPETFEPNEAITRADFAEYIVRSLGLYREGLAHENKFKDINSDDIKTLPILIASEYGIVSGYSDGTFKPEALITREEAMTMYQKAMKVTHLAGTDLDRCQSYDDYCEVSSWAESSVKEVLSAHVFNGTNANSISPKANLTYADAAQAIKNLLVESKLINK